MGRYNRKSTDTYIRKIERDIDADVFKPSLNTTEDIINKMLEVQGQDLSKSQLQKLKQTLELTLSQYNIQEDVSKKKIVDIQEENAKVLKQFINAKRIEGRSNTTLYNYAKEASRLFLTLNKHYSAINSVDIRDYLAWRKQQKNLSSTTVANMRMYLMSFFKWLYIEEYIPKNPMDKIGAIKTEQKVVEVLSDEESEMIRCACDNERDLAIIDLLSGSGIRVSELCALNRQDIDFDNNEFIVFGKGAKERVCFLTGKAKVHLKWYLESRVDDNEALFVTAKKPYSRITKNGVEYILKTIAAKSRVKRCRLYPHKYRATLATNMMNRGATVEQIKMVTGHQSTSVLENHYLKMDITNAKLAHKRFAN